MGWLLGMFNGLISRVSGSLEQSQAKKACLLNARPGHEGLGVAFVFYIPTHTLI